MALKRISEARRPAREAGLRRSFFALVLAGSVAACADTAPSEQDVQAARENLQSLAPLVDDFERHCLKNRDRPKDIASGLTSAGFVEVPAKDAGGRRFFVKDITGPSAGLRVTPNFVECSVTGAWEQGQVQDLSDLFTLRYAGVAIPKSKRLIPDAVGQWHLDSKPTTMVSAIRQGSSHAPVGLWVRMTTFYPADHASPQH